MKKKMNQLSIFAAGATMLALVTFAMPAPASADPFVGMNRAEAGALSLALPYYSYFDYSPCDFNACTVNVR